MVFIHTTVGENQDVCTFVIGTITAQTKRINRFFQRCVLVVENRNISCTESFLINGTDLEQIHFRQNRIGHLKYTAVICLFI